MVVIYHLNGSNSGQQRNYYFISGTLRYYNDSNAPYIPLYIEIQNPERINLELPCDFSSNFPPVFSTTKLCHPTPRNFKAVDDTLSVETINENSERRAFHSALYVGNPKAGLRERFVEES